MCQQQSEQLSGCSHLERFQVERTAQIVELVLELVATVHAVVPLIFLADGPAVISEALGKSR